MPNAPREPAADLRLAASAMHQLFTALIDEGFDEEQALRIIGYILAGRAPSS